MKGQVSIAENTIDLQDLLFAYLRKWWLIVLCSALVAGVALLYTMNFVTPMYTTSVSFYVNNVNAPQQNDMVSGTNLSVSRQLVNTYVNIISSNLVLEKVSQALDGQYSAEQLKKMLSSKQMGDTEIFSIQITHSNPVEAARIANTIADVAPSEITYLIDGSSARVIDEAQIPVNRSSPAYTRTVLMGGLIGFALAVAYITLIHLTDVHIKSEEGLVDNFDLPILGRIPDFTQLDASHSKKYSSKYTYNTSEGGRK